jgi:hypothetical protein
MKSPKRLLLVFAALLIPGNPRCVFILGYNNNPFREKNQVTLSPIHLQILAAKIREGGSPFIF